MRKRKFEDNSNSENYYDEYFEKNFPNSAKSSQDYMNFILAFNFYVLIKKNISNNLAHDLVKTTHLIIKHKHYSHEKYFMHYLKFLIDYNQFNITLSKKDYQNAYSQGWQSILFLIDKFKNKKEEIIYSFSEENLNKQNEKNQHSFFTQSLTKTGEPERRTNASNSKEFKSMITFQNNSPYLSNSNIELENLHLKNQVETLRVINSNNFKIIAKQATEIESLKNENSQLNQWLSLMEELLNTSTTEYKNSPNQPQAEKEDSFTQLLNSTMFNFPSW